MTKTLTFTCEVGGGGAVNEEEARAALETLERAGAPVLRIGGQLLFPAVREGEKASFIFYLYQHYEEAEEAEVVKRVFPDLHAQAAMMRENQMLWNAIANRDEAAAENARLREALRGIAANRCDCDSPSNGHGNGCPRRASVKTRLAVAALRRLVRGEEVPVSYARYRAEEALKDEVLWLQAGEDFGPLARLGRIHRLGALLAEIAGRIPDPANGLDDEPHAADCATCCATCGGLGAVPVEPAPAPVSSEAVHAIREFVRGLEERREMVNPAWVARVLSGILSGLPARPVAPAPSDAVSALADVEAPGPAALPGECSGIAASWCPAHGNCSCPRDEEGVRTENRSATECPLHGKASNHGDAEIAALDAPAALPDAPFAAFGRALLPKWWDDGNPGDIDGGDAQDAAEAAGLWHRVERHADGIECDWCEGEWPCGELTEGALVALGGRDGGGAAPPVPPAAPADRPVAAWDPWLCEPCRSRLRQAEAAMLAEITGTGGE